MKKILVVQSRTDESRIAGEQENFRSALGGNANISFLSALDERLAWSTPDEFLKDVDGVIFGGSSDFDFHGGRPAKDPARLMSLILLSRTRNIISYTLAQRLPLLGVCFGHQMVAQMHGGEVENDSAQSKFGSYEVGLTEEGAKDPVFGHLPKSFFAQYGLYGAIPPRSPEVPRHPRVYTRVARSGENNPAVGAVRPCAVA